MPAPSLPAPDRTFFDALLERHGLSPADFEIAMQWLQQPSQFADAQALVTVLCRALRVSRTYGSQGDGVDWLAEFADDVQAGVYAGVRRIRTEAAAPVDSAPAAPALPAASADNRGPALDLRA